MENKCKLRYSLLSPIGRSIVKIKLQDKQKTLSLYAKSSANNVLKLLKNLTGTRLLGLIVFTYHWNLRLLKRNLVFQKKANKMTTLPNALRVKPNMVEPSKDISVIVPLGILSVIIVLANCSVYALVCFKKTLRTYTNWLVLSLAVADILTGGVLLPFIVIKSTSVATDYLITIILLSARRR